MQWLGPAPCTVAFGGARMRAKRARTKTNARARNVDVVIASARFLKRVSVGQQALDE